MGFFAGLTSAGMNSLGNSKGAWGIDSAAQTEDIITKKNIKGIAKLRGLAYNMVNHS
jgi:CO dehydrogenase/acetyl-CoA synthase alpha subunit